MISQQVLNSKQKQRHISVWGSKTLDNLKKKKKNIAIYVLEDPSVCMTEE